MATGYGQATVEVAEKLTEAGLDVVTNVQDLNLPGGWLTPAGVEYDRMGADDYMGSWDLFLIARNTDPLDSLEDLSAMASLVRKFYPSFKADALTVTLANHSPDALPAFKIKLEMSVS